MMNPIFSAYRKVARCASATPVSTKFNRVSALLLGVALTILAPRPALADLMLYPTRIVFEKNQRAAQLELINNGQETATYRISLVNRRMNDVGEFAPVVSPLPGELFSDKLVRYSPRQVVLAPGASQIVRISLRKPTDLAPGEYRSHLQFERLPDVAGATSIDAQSSSNSDIGMSLTALIGATIPLIVRQGETSANVTFSGLTLLKPDATKGFMLAMVLERSGNSSVYGDLSASFTPHGGDESVIATANGVAVYASNAVRRVKLGLEMPSGLSLKNGNVHVTFRERPDAGGRLIAEAVLEVP